MTHGFAICAYKDSPHLAALIDSLLAQTVQSRIVIGTSTPTELLYETAARYGIEVFVNAERGGIGSDWNFAYSLSDAKYVTLAHQDDYYEPGYTESVLEAFERCKNPILAFTDYFEIRTEGPVYKSKLLNIKRLMNMPIGWFPRSRWVRRRVLSFGCPLACPSVAFNRERFPKLDFDLTMLTDLDWSQWAKLSKEKGEFAYIREALTGHRVYKESTTTLGIKQGSRYAEDLEMFRMFWPKPIAKFLMRFYATAMESND